MRKSTKRLIVIAAATVVLLGGAGIAYAYWTAGGTGTGSATTGTSESITINQTSVITNLRPGGAAQTLSGTFTNANDEPVYVSTVTASIDSVDGGPTCEVTDYTLANAVMTVNASIPIGTNVGSWTGATIAFNNKTGENQDDCKDATVTLAYTAQ
ncbi:MAG TPA: hypothetical protein VNT50_00820 [Microbacterium sp.]|uniref:hypothetical protein n=1 Tax=Microbacterium sp. TaxID=51671 RepID=UPI002C829C2F|nr:hypothetical protein [Microbacterium sp.]HWI30008.1 hypothetical protein [Microbacterium sp.]